MFIIRAPLLLFYLPFISSSALCFNKCYHLDTIIIVLCQIPGINQSPPYTCPTALLTTFSSSGFPCVGVRLIYWSRRSTVTFVICFHWSLLLALSLHFLPPLPFSGFSSHSPPILAVVFLVFWNLHASLSRLFSVVHHLQDI